MAHSHYAPTSADFARAITLRVPVGTAARAAVATTQRGCARGAGSRASGGCDPPDPAVESGFACSMPLCRRRRDRAAIEPAGRASREQPTPTRPLVPRQLSTLSTIVLRHRAIRGRTDPFDEGAHVRAPPARNRSSAESANRGVAYTSSGVRSSSCGCVRPPSSGSRPVRRTGVADDEQCSAGCDRCSRAAQNRPTRNLDLQYKHGDEIRSRQQFTLGRVSPRSSRHELPV
jgi:hypothetical protein